MLESLSDFFLNYSLKRKSVCFENSRFKKKKKKIQNSKKCSVTLQKLQQLYSPQQNLLSSSPHRFSGGFVSILDLASSSSSPQEFLFSENQIDVRCTNGSSGLWFYRQNEHHYFIHLSSNNDNQLQPLSINSPMTFTKNSLTTSTHADALANSHFFVVSGANITSSSTSSNGLTITLDSNTVTSLTMRGMRAKFGMFCVTDISGLDVSTLPFNLINVKSITLTNNIFTLEDGLVTFIQFGQVGI